MDPATHKTLAEVRQFLLKATPLEVAGAPAPAGAYAHLGCTLRRLAYWKQSAAALGLLRTCLQCTQGCRGRRPRF